MMPDTTSQHSPALDSEGDYDDPYRQSSVLPFRVSGGGMEILLITSVRKKRWIIPKGIVEPNLSPAASAAKEALEEAGCEGEVLPVRIGRYTYRKWGGVCRVEVFPMRVERLLDTWPEAAERDRAWLPASDAVERIKPKQLKSIVQKFVSARLKKA